MTAMAQGLPLIPPEELFEQATAGTPEGIPHQAKMEQKFGQDFSHVNAHRGAKALEPMNAQAATSGQTIGFQEAQPSPDVVAHELTHTMQNEKEGAAPAGLSNPQDAAEHEATAAEGDGERHAPSEAPAGAIQRSFLSFAIKAGAKKAAKGMLKNFIKTQIKRRIAKIANKKALQKFAQQADDIMGILEDPWWLTAIGFIPIVGDAIDLGRLPAQIRRAIKKADALEDKLKTYLAAQHKAMKVAKIAPASVVKNALSKFTNRKFTFGSHTILLDKAGMRHMLTRHHPKYWDGSIKGTQTFFDKSISMDGLADSAQQVLKQNPARLTQRGTFLPMQFEGVVGGTKYTVGLMASRIGQLYPH